jgi:hypothetical protein
MNCLSRTIVVTALLLFSCVRLAASPDYPFEGLLPRARIIFIGRVLKHDHSRVTFAVSESLRGEAENALTLEYSTLDDKRLTNESGDFLVLSQGDDYWGKPAPVVSLGQYPKGQASYLGWIALPIKTIGGNVSVDLVRTIIDHKGAILSLERAKTLIRQIPFKGERDASNELRISVARRGDGSWATRNEPPHNSVLN